MATALGSIVAVDFRNGSTLVTSQRAEPLFGRVIGETGGGGGPPWDILWETGRQVSSFPDALVDEVLPQAVEPRVVLVRDSAAQPAVSAYETAIVVCAYTRAGTLMYLLRLVDVASSQLVEVEATRVIETEGL